MERLTVERGDVLFWDRDLPGFGVRVYATGRKVYVVQVRGPVGNPKRVRIGVHARDRAGRGARPGGGGHRPHPAR